MATQTVQIPARIAASSGGTFNNATLTGTTTATGVILGANGSASAPEYSFTNATNYGLYYDGTSLGLAAGGVEALSLSATAAVFIGTTSFTSGTFTGTLAGPVGSTSAPTYTFTGHTTSGLYYDTVNSATALAAGGTESLYATSAGVTVPGTLGVTGTSTLGVTNTGALGATTGTFTGVVNGPVGSTSAPTFSFTGHTNSGIFYDTTNGGLGFVFNGSESMFINAASLEVLLNILVGNGSAGTPVFSFYAHTTSGMYYDTTNGGLAFASGGSETMYFTSTTATLLGSLTGTSAVFTGALSGATLQSIKTSNYQVTTGDTGKVFTVNGAGSEIVFTLPAASGSGNIYTFINTTANGVQIKAPTGATIHFGSSASSSGGTQTSTGLGSTATVIDTATNTWYAREFIGTWTAA